MAIYEVSSSDGDATITRKTMRRPDIIFGQHIRDAVHKKHILLKLSTHLRDTSHSCNVNMKSSTQYYKQMLGILVNPKVKLQ